MERRASEAKGDQAVGHAGVLRQKAGASDSRLPNQASVSLAQIQGKFLKACWANLLR